MRTDEHQSPLFSSRTFVGLLLLLAFLSISSIALSVFGEKLGNALRNAGSSQDTEPQVIAIGQDTLSIPANMIRFDNQRRPGMATVVNLELLWPTLEGYSDAKRDFFIQPRYAERLIFVELGQSVMSRDMSGRLQPIYEKLFEGAPEPGPAGLAMHRLSEKAGYGNEVILTGQIARGETFVVRCVLPKDRTYATSADCQRDVHVGRDLNLLYRFSSSLLPEWRKIDKLVSEFTQIHIRN